MSDLISVILPIFNMAEYLPACLDSILNNTYRDLEIICVDDGSTDNTPGILNSYSDKDERIRIIHQANQGTSSARNAGLSAAKGEDIAFIDPDDLIHVQYFEILKYYQQKYQSDIITCRFEMDLSLFQTNLYDIASVPSKESAYYDYIECLDTSGFVWGRLFRKSTVSDIQFRSMSIEDIPFTADVLLKNTSVKCSYVNASLYYYRQRPGSMARTYPVEAYREIADYYYQQRAHTPDPVFQTRLLHESIQNLFRFQHHPLSPKREANKTVRSLFNRYYTSALLHCSGMPLSYRLGYLIMGYFPLVYPAYWKLVRLFSAINNRH